MLKCMIGLRVTSGAMRSLTEAIRRMEMVVDSTCFRQASCNVYLWVWTQGPTVVESAIVSSVRGVFVDRYDVEKRL